jgi:hypothetical protein
MATAKEIKADWAVKVAERLGWTKDGSVQRVQNWKSRGIPSEVKLKHPDLFLPQFERREAA